MKKFKNFISGINIALKNYERANSNLWVTSLCYFSIFSLVPILAITFSIGRWLGIENYLITQLVNNSPINEELLNSLLKAGQNLLENTRSGLLAGLGFIFLVWSLLSILSILEEAFDDIWMVKKKRNFLYRISYYLTLFASFPIILVSMNGIVSLFHWQVFRFLTPYIGLTLFFTLLYILIPTSEVKLIPAFFAGFFVSIFFNQIQFLLIKLQIFINTYNKIYGSFSVILIFLLWLRFIWFFIILGGHLAYFLQNTEIFTETFNPKKLNFITIKKISINILIVLGENYLKNLPPLSIEEISKKLNLQKNLIYNVLNILKEKNLIIESFDNNFKLSCNINTLTIENIENILEEYGYNLNITSPEISNKNILLKDLINF
ncbi:YihY/virulence factor BrkB family protein [Cetobacterium sp. SF1]|uniref:YihY/virulence factor BrkB family protein n=1 Tax=Cetobacterium sp. SF1 TaxID=3417654 RepID=UPI003CEF53EA